MNLASRRPHPRIAFRALSLASALLAFAGASAATYEIDPAHSAATFSVRHMMISNVRGEFSNVKGTVVYDPQNPAASSVEATIDATTINTRVAKRDADLKSAGFFDVEKYPTLTFKSKKVTAAGPGRLRMVGDLTMHGVTKEVTLDVDGPTPEQKDPWGNVRVGASASTTLNRRDFGLNYNAVLETGGVVVGDEISITLDVEMIKKAPPAEPPKSGTN